jgi:hypothetical protein
MVDPPLVLLRYHKKKQPSLLLIHAKAKRIKTTKNRYSKNKKPSLKCSLPEFCFCDAFMKKKPLGVLSCDTALDRKLNLMKTISHISHQRYKNGK